MNFIMNDVEISQCKNDSGRGGVGGRGPKGKEEGGEVTVPRCSESRKLRVGSGHGRDCAAARSSRGGVLHG
jgi:hypothetical protein